MKKIALILLFLCSAGWLHARTVDVSTTYAGASHFNQVQARATMALTLNTLAGLEAKIADERAFKKPVYSVGLPLSLNFEFVQLVFRPFYYFKNKSNNDAFQDASAFGLNTQVRVTMTDDEVNDIYTHAFLGASFARQKGTVFYENSPYENRYYSQTAYMLGISQTLFNAFGLDVQATAFQYPDGISGVAGLRSVMDQQDLARTQTLDITHQLTKYTLGGRLSRMWESNASTLYLSYRYGEYYRADAEHSVILGNSFNLFRRVSVDMAYNHVRTIHNQNKRDIFYIQLETSF